MDNIDAALTATANAIEAAANATQAAATATTDAASALAALMAGNKRYVDDTRVVSPLAARREELAAGQSPFAIIVSCSDSRVPVDIVFDQVPGNIFGVRLAGNFVARDVLGSVEYGVAVLKAPLILVLGHSECGAIKAALTYMQDGEIEPGAIQYLVERITPAIRGTTTKDEAIAINTRAAMHDLRAQSAIISEAVKAGTVSIAGGIYDLRSGAVTLFST
jgi:carbonic anhydrase